MHDSRQPRLKQRTHTIILPGCRHFNRGQENFTCVNELEVCIVSLPVLVAPPTTVCAGPVCALCSFGSVAQRSGLLFRPTRPAPCVRPPRWLRLRPGASAPAAVSDLPQPRPLRLLPRRKVAPDATDASSDRFTAACTAASSACNADAVSMLAVHTAVCMFACQSVRAHTA